MAFYPCMRGPHPNPGRNHSIYFGYGSGSDFTRWRLRLCGLHASDVYEHLAKFEVRADDDTIGLNGALHSCLTCGEPTGEVDWQVFVTCYPAHDERKDYWSQLHVNCAVPGYLAK